MKYLYVFIVFSLLKLSLANGANALAIKEVEKELTINKSYFSAREELDNPVPEDYRTLEFFTSISVVSLGVFIGTGKSIKYFKGKKK